ncbi:MAG: hypothetical protein IJ206_12800 [Oscillospiraceae bacterium]|nr:hypothetical protein [Oscillospiraceae bacterium]
MRIRNGAAGFCVTAATAAMATARFAWPAVMLGWMVSTLVMLALGHCRREPISGPKWVVLLLGVLTMTAAVLGAERAFPEDSTFPFVSLMLLLLLWRGMRGTKRGVESTAAILGMILLPVLGAVLLFGLGESAVQWTRPAAADWKQVWISAAAASPWWCLEREKRDVRSWLWYGASAGVSLGLSVLTYGALGNALAQAEAFPLYRSVQTVRILGVLQRMEALVAAALLMGGFGILLLAGETAALGLKRSNKWKSCGVLAVVFLLEWLFRALSEQVRQITETVFWGLLPLFVLWVVFLTKNEKTS